MIQYFKDDFRFDNVSELNTFIVKIVRIAEAYISYLVARGRTYLPFDLSTHDAAIDVCAEIFETNDLHLFKFSEHFKLKSIQTEKDAEASLKSFIYTIIQNNIIELYRNNDPLTYKIIRNIKDTAGNENFYITQLLTDRYLHRNPVDFNGNYIQREYILNLLISDGNHFQHSNFSGFLSSVFEKIEYHSEFIHAVSLNDLVWLYKEIYLFGFCSSNNNGNSIDESVHVKILMENAKRKHAIRIKNYLKRNKFSEEDIIRMYSIIEDVMESLYSGGNKKSVRKLVNEYFSDRTEDGIYNKVEYVLKLFTDELISSIKSNEV